MKVLLDLKVTDFYSGAPIDIKEYKALRNLDQMNFKSFISLNFFPNLLMVSKEHHETASNYSLPRAMNNVLRLNFVSKTQEYSLLPQSGSIYKENIH